MNHKLNPIVRQSNKKPSNMDIYDSIYESNSNIQVSNIDISIKPRLGVHSGRKKLQKLVNTNTATQQKPKSSGTFPIKNPVSQPTGVPIKTSSRNTIGPSFNLDQANEIFKKAKSGSPVLWLERKGKKPSRDSNSCLPSIDHCGNASAFPRQGRVVWSRKDSKNIEDIMEVEEKDQEICIAKERELSVDFVERFNIENKNSQPKEILDKDDEVYFTAKTLGNLEGKNSECPFAITQGNRIQVKSNTNPKAYKSLIKTKFSDHRNCNDVRFSNIKFEFTNTNKAEKTVIEEIFVNSIDEASMVNQQQNSSQVSHQRRNSLPNGMSVNQSNTLNSNSPSLKMTQSRRRVKEVSVKFNKGSTSNPSSSSHNKLSSNSNKTKSQGLSNSGSSGNNQNSGMVLLSSSVIQTIHNASQRVNTLSNQSTSMFKTIKDKIETDPFFHVE